MKEIGRENDLEDINKTALRIAKEVARKNDKFFAGGLCNSNIYDPEHPETVQQCEAMFEVSMCVLIRISFFKNKH